MIDKQAFFDMQTRVSDAFEPVSKSVNKMTFEFAPPSSHSTKSDDELSLLSS